MSGSGTSEPAAGRGGWFAKLREPAITLLAALLYLLLVDAAVAAFFSASPVRWWVVGGLAAYLGTSALLWRRAGSAIIATASCFVLLGLVALLAWLPQGLTTGVSVARQPTSTVLSVATALIILFAGIGLGRLKFVSIPGCLAIGLLVAYGVAAFGVGIITETPYPDLFRGHSLWDRLPIWLQGAFVGTLVLPLALGVQLVYGLLRVRGSALRPWGVQVLALSMGLVIAGAGFGERLGIAPAPKPPEVTTLLSPQELAALPRDMNLVVLDVGGQIERFTSQYEDDRWSAKRLIDDTPGTGWGSAKSPTYPQEIVFSFLARQPARISSVIVSPQAPGGTSRWAKDVEVWTSLDSPSAGFKRVGSVSLRAEPVEQTIAFAPVEARYVKLRILSNHGDPSHVVLGKVKIIEGHRPGYIPLLARVLSPPVAPSQPGVVSRYFADHSFHTLKKSVVTQTLALDSSAPPVVPLDGKRFWVEWEGLLSVPMSGRYDFRLEGDDNGFLYLDGQRVIRERQRPGDQTPREGGLFLAAGTHAIRLAAIQERIESRFALRWKKAGDQDYSPIDPKFLSATEAQRQWRRGPRQAAQVGIEWLQSDSLAWQKYHRCFGCHVQAQAIMGMSVAKENNYIVSEEYLKELVEFTQRKQNADGTHSGYPITATQFAAMGLSFFGTLTNAKQNDTLLKSVNWLLNQQKPDGEIPIDQNRPPIAQGSIMTTANSVMALLQAFKETGDARYKEASDRALGWISTSKVFTTQDKIFKVIVLARFGTPEQRRIADQVVEQLKAEQLPGGSWNEDPNRRKPSDYATGQVLCAFKEAGVGVNTLEFRRGVRFLLHSQRITGDWEQSGAATEFAPTMWPVICLAGAFVNVDFVPDGTLQVVSDIKRTRKPTKNLVIILDSSGSMNERLGQTTRWGTALEVFKEVVEKLPDDFNVGLRVYAHRHPPKSSKSRVDITRLPTCTDTELLVPAQKLDRGRILSAISRLKPRGETPLVYAVLQTIGDLRGVGGGSVVLITDGEETCGANPRAAAEQLKAAGIDITLNIVGFTLTGKKLEEEMTAFAEATGGRYFSAQSGEELTRALLIAAVETFRYAIFDAVGKQVAKGDAGASPEELPPGDYRVVVQAADQELVENVKVTADTDMVLKVVLKGQQFAIER
ncbi:MAG: discoidin domain-containing protein [Candidatus Methylomirabilales bacterium]